MDACSPEAPSSCTPWWHNVSFLLQRRGCSTCGNSLVSRPVPRTATPELVETTGSFPHPPRWWSNFQTRSGKISSPNTSISLAFRRQWKDVRRNFCFFFQLCVTGWHRGVWTHRFSVKNKHSGATMLFLRVCLRRWSINSNDLPMITSVFFLCFSRLDLCHITCAAHLPCSLTTQQKDGFKRKKRSYIC